MLIKIIGALIGALLAAAGLYYLVRERGDRESRKIYGIMSGIGIAIFAVMLILALSSR